MEITKNEAEICRQLMKTENLSTRELITKIELKQEERYNSTYNGLSMIFQDNQERSFILKQMKENQEANLETSNHIGEIVTNNERSLHQIEEDIMMVKNFFEGRIMDIQILLEREKETKDPRVK
jgi:hypothetical protein